PRSLAEPPDPAAEQPALCEQPRLFVNLNALEREPWRKILQAQSIASIAKQEGVSRAAIYARIQGNNKGQGGMVARIFGSCCGGCSGSGPFSKNTMIEKLIAAAWNRLAASNKSTAEQGSGLDLGFQVIDGEILRRRAHLPQSKRAEHLAILGKTGQGKSFFLRHLAGQDIQRGQGFVFFD